MGFQFTRQTAVLEFDGDFQGAEVRVRLDVPLGYFLEAKQLEDAGNQIEAYKHFVEHALIDWNLLDEDGIAIPATYEGMQQVPHNFLSLVIVKWAELVAGIPIPLDGSLVNGNQLAAVSTPTAEELSLNLKDFSKPN